MSTLEISCDRCGKKFRVRAEFAGRSTRCPGCSAPLSIGGAASAPPPEAFPPLPKYLKEKRPRNLKLSRRTSVEGDWKIVDSACRREQLAVFFAFGQLVTALLGYCFVQMLHGGDDILFRLILLVLVFSPTIIAVVFSLIARFSIVRFKSDAIPRGAIRSSLMSTLSSGICFLAVIFILLASIDSRPPELILGTALIGFVVSIFFAMGSFMIFMCQVGIARSSREVSKALAGMGLTMTITLIIELVLVFFYSIAIESSNNYSANFSRVAYRNDEPFYRLVAFFFIPVLIIVFAILYHRVLAAVRRSLREEEILPKSEEELDE